MTSSIMPYTAFAPPGLRPTVLTRRVSQKWRQNLTRVNNFLTQMQPLLTLLSLLLLFTV